jgi:hypothetical protein
MPLLVRGALPKEHLEPSAARPPDSTCHLSQERQRCTGAPARRRGLGCRVCVQTTIAPK